MLQISKPVRPALLLILDGFGIGPDSPFNAIENARMPFFKELRKKYPYAKLITHGEAVGLPEGIMGNSEVGHMTLGAGRILYQDLMRINRAISDKSFFSNPVLQKLAADTRQAGGRLHLMGLISNGGVHSHLDHLDALLEWASSTGIAEVFVHAFMDGRDTAPTSGKGFLERVLAHPVFQVRQDAQQATGQNVRQNAGHSLAQGLAQGLVQSSGPGTGSARAKLASIHGRYYAMDRDKRWERIDKSLEVLLGKKAATLRPWPQVLGSSKKGDEFVEPELLDKNGALREGDGVFFFNFRADRARQLTTKLGIERPVALAGFSSMTSYDETFTTVPSAFRPQTTDSIFPECLAATGARQFRIAETEKYAHVTFFFNCGREKPFQGEERLLIPSPKDVPTYDLKPEMSAFQVAEDAKRAIESQKYGFVLINFANADMIGHTGDYEAALRSMEALDSCLTTVIGAAERSGFDTLLTADHGNCETMRDEHGEPHTQHTLNPVPVILIPPGSAVAPKSSRPRLSDGTLADIAPTLLERMGLPKPPAMLGKSLVRL